MLREKDINLLNKAICSAATLKGCTGEEIENYKTLFSAIARGEDKESDLAKQFKKLFDMSQNAWKALANLSAKKMDKKWMPAYEFALMMVILASTQYVKTGQFVVCNTCDNIGSAD